MKIYLLSDIHLEFGKFRPNVPSETDVIVLAGDIGVGRQGIAWADQQFSDFGIPILYVPGNHEYWGRRFDEHMEDMRDVYADRGIHFLNNDAMVIDDIKFIGATLWTDFNLVGLKHIDKINAMNIMNDFSRIGGFTIDTWEEENTKSYKFICENIDYEKVVVISHHAPSIKSINRVDAYSSCYASNYNNLMGYNNQIKLWVHGHVHDSFDYMVGDCRVVTNPRGYVGHSLNPNFVHDLIIEV